MRNSTFVRLVTAMYMGAALNSFYQADIDWKFFCTVVPVIIGYGVSTNLKVKEQKNETIKK